MLAVFHTTVASPPEEINTIEEESSRQTDSAGIVESYKKDHPNAVTIAFGKRCAMAYSHDKEELLKPRYLAVTDEIFCMFVGTLENLTALRQQYGVAKQVTEVTLIIEIYRALRDRSPYTSDHVMRALQGTFAFVLFDNTSESIFVGVDAEGRVPFWWGTGSDGSLAFSDDPTTLKETTGKTFSPFPQGCFFSSADGLQSYMYPKEPVTALPRVDSQGEVCGTTFKVNPAKKETLRAYSFPRVGSENWGK